MKLTEKELDALVFLYTRLILVYDEHPNYDYMLSFKDIIEKLERERQETI